MTQAMRNEYLVGAHGFVLCVSLADASSLQDVPSHLEKIVRAENQSALQLIPVILAGTKSDAKQIKQEDVNAMATKYQLPYIETSAKANTNVKEAFCKIVKLVTHMQQKQQVEKKKQPATCSLQ